jgi:hypothetical protein
MSNKIVNIVANVILPVVTIAVTVGLFFMFRSENPTALFYINVGYAILLEAIFFGYINVLYRKISDFSTPFVAVFGIFSLYYVIIGFGWMLVFSLILSHFFSLKIYIAVLLILTLLWIILSVLMGQADSNYRTTTDNLKGQRYTLEFYTQKITLLASRYDKLCAEKGIKYETDSNNRTPLDRLKGKISFLTPNILKNETAVSQLNSMLDKCESIIDETESVTEDKLTEVSKKMQRFTDNALAELDMLKNLTRK